MQLWQIINEVIFFLKPLYQYHVVLTFTRFPPYPTPASQLQGGKVMNSGSWMLCSEGHMVKFQCGELNEQFVVVPFVTVPFLVAPFHVYE
jgi:hypothetical protein